MQVIKCIYSEAGMRLNHQRSATSKKHQETEHHREKAASSNKRDMHRAAEDQTT